jgi:hypothetical protein
MSIDAGVSIKLFSPSGPDVILDALLASRWLGRLGRKEGWWCISRGEGGPGWSLLDSSDEADLVALFRVKLAAAETFGLRLWWEGQEVGGEFLLLPSCEVLFTPSMNRATLDERTTDVSWYMARLLPIFGRESGVRVESWTWRETG